MLKRSKALRFCSASLTVFCEETETESIPALHLIFVLWENVRQLSSYYQFRTFRRLPIVYYEFVISPATIYTGHKRKYTAKSDTTDEFYCMIRLIMEVSAYLIT